MLHNCQLEPLPVGVVISDLKWICRFNFNVEAELEKEAVSLHAQTIHTNSITDLNRRERNFPFFGGRIEVSEKEIDKMLVS